LAEEALVAVAQALRDQALASNQRRALVLAGPADWGLDAAKTVLAGSAAADGQAVWLSDRIQHQPRLPIGAAERLLGLELDTLVYDAHSGIDLDALGAALGSLTGGGLLVLLAPALDVWPERANPLCTPGAPSSQACPHPMPPASPGRPSRLVRRLVETLTRAEGVALVQAGQPFVALPAGRRERAPPALASIPPDRDAAGGDRTTTDQRLAVAAILKTARGRARRPLVLTSDRGRGKSSALGLAAAELLAGGRCEILVTAPRHQAVAPVFAHAARLLPDAQMAPGLLRRGAASLRFLAPDHLAQTGPHADLLLVDEAAGIPAPLLETLLRRYPRVVFATTVHGYEGTGRGFEVRFRQTLERLTPGWRSRTLITPIRWAEADPIEALLARALLLDASPAAAADVATATPRTCTFTRLDRDALAGDEQRLRELFGLLVLAHYQTRPADLHQLLDGPTVRVYALSHRGHIAATALAVLEGRLDPDLGAAVFAGLRRPPGHLLPQTLSAHAGMGEATGLGYLRLVRIAVHPALQGRGLGRMLVARIQTDALDLGLDLLGASFGATVGLLRFWRRCGLTAVHIGTSRNAASGAHAAVVLAGLSPAGIALTERSRRRLLQRIPALLAGVLRDLEPELAVELMAHTPQWAKTPGLDHQSWREIAAFAFASRPFEAVVAPLGSVAAAALAGDRCPLSTAQAEVLVAAVLQHRRPNAIAALTAASGRAEVVATLRAAAQILCQCLGPAELAADLRDPSARCRPARAPL